MSNEEFIEKIAPLVITENKKRGNPLFPSVVIAQSCLETGYGKSNIMMLANAIFGIKATSNWSGKVYNCQTKECFDNVNFTTISACFRAYDNLEESISDYFNLILTSSRYRNALFCDTAEECITAIKNGGYATDPNYINLILRIIKMYNLTRFDKIEELINEVYKVGEIYTTQVILNVREGVGTNSRKLNYEELTENAQEHAYKTGVNKGCLKKGTRITCLEIIKENENTWIRIPSGFIAGYYDGKIYVE